MEKTITFNIPEGYVIDKENSTDTNIVLKLIEPSRPKTWEEYCEKMEGKDSYYINPKLSWINVKDSLPKQDEEVIVLRDEFNTSYFYKISFAHIVDKTVCRDYNGWNVPDVVYWFPMPKIPKTGD